MSTIHVGTEVEFQVTPAKDMPRWDYYNGSPASQVDSGPWTRGVVMDVRPRNSNPLQWKAMIYAPELRKQWWFLIDMFDQPHFYPGGPKTKVVCECGADKAAGGNAYGAHSHWCPKSGKTYYT